MANIYLGPLSVKGTGTDADPFEPALPGGVTGAFKDYGTWTAWYSPENAPYDYCLVTLQALKKPLPLAVNRLTLTPDTLKNNYTEAYKGLVSSRQIIDPSVVVKSPVPPDPASESWNFDSDVVGALPTGWANEIGSLLVSNLERVSVPNSARYNGAAGAATAGSARTGLHMTGQMRWDDDFSGNHALLARVSPDSDNCYAYDFRENNATLNLKKRVKAASTTIISMGWVGAPDTFYNFEWYVFGTNAQCWLDGVQMLPNVGWSAIGADFASGIIGVRYSVGVGTNQAYYDDIFVEDYPLGGGGAGPMGASVLQHLLL